LKEENKSASRLRRLFTIFFDWLINLNGQKGTSIRIPFGRVTESRPGQSSSTSSRHWHQSGSSSGWWRWFWQQVTATTTTNTQIYDFLWWVFSTSDIFIRYRMHGQPILSWEGTYFLTFFSRNLSTNSFHNFYHSYQRLRQA